MKTEASSTGDPRPVERPRPSFFIGARVLSRTNGQAGHVTGFRSSGRLGFRYVVIWDDRKGYSLVPPADLVTEPSEPRAVRDRRRSAG